MYEMQSAGPGTPVSGGTIRKNPSQQKKLVLDDGSEVTSEHLDQLRRQVADKTLQVDVLQMQNDYLKKHVRAVALTQYVSKDLLDSNDEDTASTVKSLQRFIDTINEDMDMQFQSEQGSQALEDRKERITILKRENIKLADAYEAEAKAKKSYKNEVRATKKMAKQALRRVEELEAEIKSDAARVKKESTEYKVEIHSLKGQLEEMRVSVGLQEDEVGGEKSGNTSRSGSRIGSRIGKKGALNGGESGGRTRSESNAGAMSGISSMDTTEIEGGVGQKMVHLKEKRAAAYSKEKGGGRYETMRNLDGEVRKTESGLTVIDTNKKVEKIVAHEMNVAKIQVVEGRNLTPEKKPRHGMEVWFKLEMGSATFQSSVRSIADVTESVPWNHEYAYVVSTGLQSKPMIPLTVYYRPLTKNGQSGDGDGKVLGQIVIPLTTFLPLIGSDECVSQWMTVTEKDTKEVRGIVQLVLRVDSNVSRSERMLPLDEGFTTSLIKSNIAGTMQRAEKIMSEEAPIEEMVDLNPLQQKASKANPDMQAVCQAIHDGAEIDPEWRNFRRQNWLHFAAMIGDVALVKKLATAVSSNLKVVDATDKAGFSPFLYAVMGGHVGVCQYLRHVKNLNVNRSDWNGNTPMHLAAMFGHEEMIDFLLSECRLSTDLQDENAATPLHHCAYMGHKECVIRLCNAQAMVNAEDRDGNSPLLLSLIQNHLETAQYLKDDKKADITSYNTRGDTCLWATIQTGSTDMMNILLKDQRTDLGRKLGHYDFTLLMRCLLTLDYALCDKIVGVILSQKPDVNLTNKLGQTALYYAVAMNRPNLVTLLIMAGALVRFKDKSGNTPLHLCNNENIAKTLMQHGAGQQVNVSNVQGNTPLHCAFAFGGPNVADVILSAGGDMTKKNNNGLTPADCVLVDVKYIALPFYEEDRSCEHSIFIGSRVKVEERKGPAPPADELDYL